MNRLLFALLLMFPLVGFAQDCQDFKTGTYKCRKVGGEWVQDYRIVRKKSIQMEYSSEGYIKSKVVWIDSCTYHLVHIKSDYLDLPKGNVSRVRIVKFTDNGYIAEGNTDAYPNRKMQLDMKKLE